MKLADFIKQNKVELDSLILKVCPNCKLNNEERRQWVLNDEGLYCWAKKEGVRFG